MWDFVVGKTVQFHTRKLMTGCKIIKWKAPVYRLDFVQTLLSECSLYWLKLVLRIPYLSAVTEPYCIWKMCPYKKKQFISHEDFPTTNSLLPFFHFLWLSFCCLSWFISEVSIIITESLTLFLVRNVRNDLV